VLTFNHHIFVTDSQTLVAFSVEFMPIHSDDVKTKQSRGQTKLIVYRFSLPPWRTRKEEEYKVISPLVAAAIQRVLNAFLLPTTNLLFASLLLFTVYADYSGDWDDRLSLFACA